MFNQPSSTGGSVVEPSRGPAFAPSAPGRAPQATGATLASQYLQPPKKTGTIIETVLLIIAIAVAAIFIGMFLSKTVAYENLASDIDGQIDAAVAMAVAENTTKMEGEFAEREKYPYRSFIGPADYGSLSFEYPQTWSLYVSSDAANGGDFEAYFNPVEIEPLNGENVNALHLMIRDTTFDSVVAGYESQVASGELTFTTRNLNGVSANIYSGQLQADMRGAVAVIKVRDKAIIIQTEAEIFADDFYRLLDTVKVIQ